jgi:hypothetical protein
MTRWDGFPGFGRFDSFEWCRLDASEMIGDRRASHETKKGRERKRTKIKGKKSKKGGCSLGK